MTDHITAYPLCWPPHMKRAQRRSSSKFKTSLPGALKNVEGSLRLFSSDSKKKIENLVISSNVTLGEQRPKDSGVAVWFVWDGLQVCFPVDRYEKVQDNLQAVHHIIEARRTELRHGGFEIVRATFTGFAALPDPSSAGGLSWRQLLSCPDTKDLKVVKKRYMEARSKYHQDRPTADAEMFHQVQLAWEQARRELG